MYHTNILVSLGLVALVACGGADSSSKHATHDDETETQNPCKPEFDATAKKVDGVCTYTCNDGFVNKGDTKHPDCQGCKPQHHTTATVVNGACNYTCEDGFLNHGDATNPDCQACDAKPNATANVVGGACSYSCNSGIENTGDSTNPVCERCAPGYRPNGNPGAAGLVCTPKDTCTGLQQIQRAASDGGLHAPTACPATAPYCVQPDANAPGRCVARDALIFKTAWSTTYRPVRLSIQVTDDPSFPASDFDIDCEGDGTFEFTKQTAKETSFDCEYTELGPYTVTIRGFLQSARLSPASPLFRLIRVDSWGLNPWVSMAGMFKGITAKFSISSLPNLRNTIGMSEMFSGCTNFNHDIGDWDTSAMRPHFNFAD